MADLYFPSALNVSGSRFNIVSVASRFRALSGVTRIYERSGDYWRASLDVPPGNAEHGATLRQLIAALRGGVNSVWLHDHSYVQRGSFPSTELLTNNTFANGTTGWTDGSEYSGSVSGRTWKAQRTAVTISQPALVPTASATVTQYAPHVVRAFRVSGQGSYGTIGNYLGSTQGGTDYGGSASSLYGLLSTEVVPRGSSAWVMIADNASSGLVAGDHFYIPYVSLSRCALVDNGPNLLLQSQDFTTTWTNARSTDAANSTAAPDGTTTADSIIEDGTASNTHHVEQGATVATSAADYCFSVSLKAGTRSFARVDVVEGTSSHTISVYVNLSTGALGTAAVSGANWTNPRAFMVSQGNGWYRVTIVGRKVSASTTLTPRVFLATDITTHVYSGDGASLIYAWGASLAQSSVPVRYTATTTTAATGSNQTGSGLHIKGLPASTAGLLLPDDRVQIGDEYETVVAPLDSDAAGLGFLQLARPRRQIHADNEPVIINQPMCRMMLSESENGWQNMPGRISVASIELVEDLRD